MGNSFLFNKFILNEGFSRCFWSFTLWNQLRWYKHFGSLYVWEIFHYKNQTKGRSNTKYYWRCFTCAGLSTAVAVDRNRKTFIPWPYSEECSRYRIYFARQKSLPMTALVSFPGSGNTWVRYLLDTASGVFTGSVYIDRKIISKGMQAKSEKRITDWVFTGTRKSHLIL